MTCFVRESSCSSKKDRIVQMNDIMFKCPSCASHMSASTDDVGFGFDCPECGEAITVPAGDILFDCPHCRVSLLASANAAGDEFECPHCQVRVLVPGQGREAAIPAREQTAPITPLPIPQARPVESPSDASSGPKGAGVSQSDQQFMIAWGDYLAAAGLTNQGGEHVAPAASTEDDSQNPKSSPLV